MDKKILLICAVLFLIGILCLVSWTISNRMSDMEKDCVNTFDVNGTCPCFPQKSVPFTNSVFNFSILNQTSS